jgi:hypothetical protein
MIWLGWLVGGPFEGEKDESGARAARLLGNVIGLGIFAMMAWVVLRGF